MEQRYYQRKFAALIVLTLLFCLILFLFLFIRSSAAERGRSDEPASLGSLIIDGQPVEVSYVMKVEEQPVSLDEFRYYYFTEKARMSGADDSYFEEGDRQEKEETLKRNTEQSLLRDQAILKLADENGLALSKSEKQQIDSDVKSQIDSLGGKGQYLKALAKVNMTDSIYRTQWKISYLYEKLYQYYFEKTPAISSASAIAGEASDGNSEENGDTETVSNGAVTSKSPSYSEIGQKDSDCEELLEQVLDQEIEQLEISYGPAYDSINLDTLK